MVHILRTVQETTVVAGLARVQYWPRCSEVLRLRLREQDTYWLNDS